MSGIIKVIIVGRLGNDPEIKSMPNGDAVANISVAVGESWKDRQTGEKKERTEWVRCVAFKKLAEIMGQYLTKGSQVYLEGKLQTRKWQAQDGSDRYSTEVIVSQMQMLGGGERNPQQANNAPQQQAPQQDDFDDDIPF